MSQGTGKQQVIITTPQGFAGVTDSASNKVSIYGTVTGYGTVRVSEEPSSLMYDTFESLDTTVRWTSTVSGTGAANTVATGSLTQGCGTSNSGYATLVSQPTFAPIVPSFTQVSWALQIPDGASPGTTSWRFFGVGTAPGAPATTSASTFLTDAIGWEIDTTGAFNAVVYAGGSRTIIAALTSRLDASAHRFICQHRTDRVFWYIDSLDVPLAVASNVTPQTQVLPVRTQCVSTSSGTTNKTFVISGVAVTDTSRNNTQLSDATYPFRKATITAGGQLLTASTTATAPTLSNVASSASSVQILASNTNRKRATLYNDSTAILYLKLGTTASNTSYTVQIPAGGYYEFPDPCYTGQVDGIWASANGNARVTEIT